MRLVHFTEGPLHELASFVKSQGSLEKSRAFLGNPFYSTDQELMEDLRKTFKRYEMARVDFDAPIVRNLALVRTKKRGDSANGPVRKP